MHALFTTPQSASNLNRYLDSGATHHLIANLANLNVRANEYQDSNQICIVMVLVWVLNTLVLLNYQLLLPLLFYMMFYMFLILPKIWSLFINLPLILIHPLNFTLLISLWRIDQWRKFCFVGWVEMGCTYFLLLSLKSICRHLLLLVNVLLQISGAHAWDILLFVLFVMFFLDLACLLVPIKLFTLVLLVSALRVNNFHLLYPILKLIFLWN